MSGEEPPSTPADLARTLREAADRLMGGWTSALTSPFGSPAGGTADAPGTAPVSGEAAAPQAASSGQDELAAPRDTSGTGRAVASGPTWPGGAAVPGMPDLSALLGPLVPPATLSARQLQAVLDDLAARRAQVQALRTQLGLFDEQLAALETSLGPVLEWTKAWAGMEQKMTDLWRPPSP